MASLRQLKKQLVHAAVVENVDLIRNRVPMRAPRAERAKTRRFVLPTLLSAALLVASIGVVAWSPPLRANLESLANRMTNAVLSSPGTSSETVFASLDGEPETIVVLNPDAAKSLVFDEAPREVDRRIFPLGMHTIVLDPGHGGGNHGTQKDDLREKDITLDIATKLEQLLLDKGFRVVLTRDDDRDVELDERVALANRNQGDLFLSIHVNWLGRAGGGVETFYLGNSDDPRIVELTATENRDSGYTLKDFRNLLDGLYVDVRRDESRSVAEAVQESLHTSLREVSPKLRDRGVKSAPFVVLIGTEMPAILAEVSSLSDSEEARLLRDATYRERIAEALYDGILTYAETLEVDPATDVTSSL